MHGRRRFRPPQLHRGFSLVEVLLALLAGSVLLGVISQVLVQESLLAARLNRVTRERLLARRALELLRDDMQQALEVSSTLPADGHPGCSFTGRTVKLHLLLPDNARVSYSIDARPEAIWRSAALYRCGPAYGIDGTLNAGGGSVSRVVVDGLEGEGLRLEPDGPIWRLQLFTRVGSVSVILADLAES